MAFKPGDKVKFLNDVGGGIISRIQDDKIAHVRIEDGFDVPVLLTELVPDEPDFDHNFDIPPENEDTANVKSREESQGSMETTTDIQEKKTEIEDDHEVDVSVDTDDKKLVFLAFVKEEDELTMNVFLVNDSSYTLFHNMCIENEYGFQNFSSGVIKSNTKLKIASVTKNDLLKIIAFRIELMFYKRGIYMVQKPTVDKVDIRNIPFDKAWAFTENDYFHENALLIEIALPDLAEELKNLSKEEFRLLQKKREAGVPQRNKQVKQKPEIEEVDLHIHEIIDNEKDLSNGEILEIQMSRFTTALEGAIKNNLKKIVFIHGVGNGKLKYELRKTLDTSYPDIKYQDASFQQYGYGATLVLIK